MSLSIEAAVLGMADVMRTRIGPTLTDEYAIEANRLAAVMLTIMGSAADDAVALRVAEHAELRALLGDAAALVDEPDVAARLTEASQSTDPGLRISELDAESGRLRTLLMDVQVRLETASASAATAMTQRIWRLLQTIEQNRAPRC